VLRVDGTDAGEQAREVAARVAGDEEAGCGCHRQKKGRRHWVRWAKICFAPFLGLFHLLA